MPFRVDISFYLPLSDDTVLVVSVHHLDESGFTTRTNKLHGKTDSSDRSAKYSMGVLRLRLREGKVKKILFKHGTQLLVFDNKDRQRG